MDHFRIVKCHSLRFTSLLLLTQEVRGRGTRRESINHNGERRRTINTRQTTDSDGPDDSERFLILRTG
jgi:hypothetical protein